MHFHPGCTDSLSGCRVGKRLAEWRRGATFEAIAVAQATEPWLGVEKTWWGDKE